MKSELTRLLEIDALYGEISLETAKNATSEAGGCALGLIISFVTASFAVAASSGCLLAGHYAIGTPFGIIGVFFLFASRYFKKEAQKYDDILMAYTQRARLKELRVGTLEYEIDIGTSSPQKRRLPRKS